MLSIKTIGTSTKAHKYYSEYAQEKGESKGIFYDKTREIAPTERVIESQEMKNLFSGFDAEGKHKLCKNAGENHRAGWDLTFSAPKSVSIVWSSADDGLRQEIETAQLQATKAGLDYMNNQALYVRSGTNGLNLEKADMVASIFKHSSNRAEEPHLHSHAIVYNIAKSNVDGVWRTVEPKTMFQAKMAAGAVYKVELAHRLQKLGFEVEKTKDSFDICGVPKNVCVAQSSRSIAIEEELEKHGLDRATANSAIKELFALETRPDKKRLGCDFKTWQAENQNLGFGQDEIAKLRHTNLKEHTNLREGTLLSQRQQQKLVETSLKDLTDNASVFHQFELERKLAENSIGKQSSTHLFCTIRNIKDSNLLVDLEAKKKGLSLYTTKDMIEREQDILNTIRSRTKEAAHPINTHVYQQAIKNRPTIKEEQVNALAYITKGAEGVCFIEGDAGTGKSYLMNAVKEVYEKSGYTVRGLSFTNKAAMNLQEGSGIQSTSVDSFLLKMKHNSPQIDHKSIIVLDEAGMLGSTGFKNLLDICKKNKAKLVCIGDKKQIQPIHTGQIFGSITTLVGSKNLTTIVRQTHKWERAAVKDFAEGKSTKAIEAIDKHGNLHICDSRIGARKKVIDLWKQNQHKDVLMIVTTNKEVDALNQAARNHLKADGTLGAGRDILTDRGTADMAVGDRIIFTGNYKSLGILNSTLATIQKISSRSGNITVKTENKKTITFDPKEMNQFRHGYAVTAHKSQGSTIDKAIVLVDGHYMDSEKVYVAMSRGRDGNVLICDKVTLGEPDYEHRKTFGVKTSKEYALAEENFYQKQLCQLIGSSRKKETTLDYTAISQNQNVKESTLEGEL